MKSLLAMVLLGAFLVSGCTAVVVQETVISRPNVTVYDRVVVPTPYCYWHETPVYGHADIYRDGHTHVRLKQVAYVDRQWRCH